MSIRIKRTRTTGVTARNLRDSLEAEGNNVKLLRPEGSSWRGTNKSLLVNWGCSSPINSGVNAIVFNKPNKISNASDKIKSFELFEQNSVSYPWYVTTEDNDFISVLAARINQYPNTPLMFRTTSTGYGGAGIYVLDDIITSVCTYKGIDIITTRDIHDYLTYLKNEDPEWSTIINNTKFVTEYFKAKDEFRVHVICGSVVFCQRKALRTDDDRPEEPNFYIRNHSNGFIFQQNNIEVPEMVKQESIKAVNALGLDFGAVDIRFKRSRSQGDSCKVLEVNTAPSLTGNTLKAYTDVFNSVHRVLNEA